MEYIKLKDVCKTTQGIQISKENQKTNFEDGLRRYLYIADFKSDDDLKYVIDNYDEKIVTEKDLVMANTGSPGAVFKGKEGILSNNLFKISFDNKKINRDFLYYYLSSENFQGILQERMKGGVQKHLGHKTIGEQSFPLIDFNSQNKIVEVLDKTQELIEKRKEQIGALDELVKSRFIEMFGDPIKNHKKLAKAKLSDLGEWKSGGTPSRSNNEYYNGNIPWLSSGELNNKYCFSSNEMITELAINESSAKIIAPGSLLLGMYDTAALKSTINMIECSCNQAIAYSKLDDNLVNTIYIYYCIQIGKGFYKSQQRGVRQKNLNLSMVKGLEVLMPSLELQNEFADFVKQVDKLKFKMENSLKELEDNFNSLMQKAFKGELFK